jgi:hypothetical protein
MSMATKSPYPRSRQDVRAAATHVGVCALGATACVTITLFCSSALALRLVGMPLRQFVGEYIIAGSTIVIHLILDRSLHQTSRHRRCLRAFALTCLLARLRRRVND